MENAIVLTYLNAKNYSLPTFLGEEAMSRPKSIRRGRMPWVHYK
jgi:hypothetical protein